MPNPMIPIREDETEPLTDSAYDVLANLAGVHRDKIRELSSAYLLARILRRHPEVFDPIDLACGRS